MEILKLVITSWQVIVTTIGLIIYLNIVFYVSKAYRIPRASRKISLKRKQKSQTALAGGPETTSSGDNVNDELGLEEG